MNFNKKIEHQENVIENLRYINEYNELQNEKLISEISLLEKKLTEKNYDNENQIKSLVKLCDDLKQENKEKLERIEELVSK